jgi:hypothetical protein
MEKFPKITAFVLVGIFIGMCIGGTLVRSSSQVPITEVTAYNPYSFGISIEVKCDWNNQTRSFNFLKYYLLPGKESITLRIPKTMSKCEVWPKVDW